MNVSTNIVTVNKLNLTACLDGGLSQIYFDDFQSNMSGRMLSYYGRNGTEFLVLMGEGLSINDKHYKKSHLNKMKRAELLKECALFEECFDPEWYNVKETRAELISYLSDKDHEDYYNSLYQSDISWHDLPSTFSVTGYSQGDVFKVLIIGKGIEYINREFLENIYFGTPFHVHLTIEDQNGDEIDIINLAEYVNSYTCYDREEALKYFKEALETRHYKDQAIEFLDDNLPSSLDYED